jgi:hypothetical protein
MMISEHQAPTPLGSETGPVTDNAQRVAAHIARALRHAGYSCAVVNLSPSPAIALAHAEPSISFQSAASNDDD